MSDIKIAVIENSVKLDGATVSLYQDGAFVASGVTASGIVMLTVVDGTYEVRAYKRGFTTNTPANIVVSAVEINEFAITADSSIPLVNSDQCSIYGNIIESDGTPSDSSVHWTEVYTSNTRELNIVGSNEGVSYTDGSGRVSLPLLRNVTYHVSMPEWGDEYVTVTVPDRLSCDIVDLLYPKGVILGNVVATFSGEGSTPFLIGTSRELVADPGAFNLFDIEVDSEELSVVQDIDNSSISFVGSVSGVYTVSISNSRGDTKAVLHTITVTI